MVIYDYDLITITGDRLAFKRVKNEPKPTCAVPRGIGTSGNHYRYHRET